MDLRVPDVKGYRTDRFIILQKKESELRYQIGDYFNEIRQDEDTIPVWYTEERYRKIMTFWYAAHGKEYVESADKPDPDKGKPDQNES